MFSFGAKVLPPAPAGARASRPPGACGALIFCIASFVLGFDAEAQVPPEIGLAMGNDHSCTITYDGRVKCWGVNASGQLGDGTTTNRRTPLDVIGLSGLTIMAIAAGQSHTCAVSRTSLSSPGVVKCWGDNSYGQLGDGTRISRAAPVSVAGLAVGTSSTIAAGSNHTCVLDTSGGSTGRLKCWGQNTSGQLGDGTLTDSAIPVNVSGAASGVYAIAAGGFQSCAIFSAFQSSITKCWGSN